MLEDGRVRKNLLHEHEFWAPTISCQDVSLSSCIVSELVGTIKQAKCRIRLAQKGPNVASKAIHYLITSTLAQMKDIDVPSEMTRGTNILIFVGGNI